MSKKIIIAADEAIVCPSCSHQFALDQGITRHTIEGYENDFAETFAAQSKELEGRLAKEAERKASKLFSDQLTKLQEDLVDVREAEKAARAGLGKGARDAGYAKTVRIGFDHGCGLHA